MGRNAIARGNTRQLDHHAERDRRGQGAGGEGPVRPRLRRSRAAAGAAGGRAGRVLRACCDRPEDRDPRGYILPADQPDFLTATKFVNALIEVRRRRSTGRRPPSPSAGKQYPAGSYVVKTGQAFRPHVLDMFEPQDYPDDFAYPGGPPDAAVRQRRLHARASRWA